MITLEFVNKLAERLCVRQPTEIEAYGAGFDCGQNGADNRNCHFAFFGTKELTAAWERGNKAGLQSLFRGGDKK